MPDPWVISVAALCYIFGFSAVGEIYRADEERLGATPFERASHLIAFVGFTALIWPVVWLNWEFRMADCQD
ncbi:MAG: hypothetical protein CMO80_18505 [Verrucomicrobiales bacterium]|nr:hypothetical protein [Verrucomicrobiales bacterium]